jgi:fatty acid desaturase
MAFNPASPSLPVDQKQTFSHLRAMIKESALLDRQPFYYAWRFPLTIALLAPSIYLLSFDILWLQALNAIFLAFVFTQIVFLGHDCGHRQIFRGAFWNDIAAMWGIPVIGVSYSWWCHNHNKHHSQPNQMGADPAIEYDMFVFSKEQAARMKGIRRFLIKYQGYYFVPLTLFYPIAMRVQSIAYLLKNKPKWRVAETLLFLLHFPIYFGLIFYFLSPSTGIIFVLIHQCVFSLFLVSTFAPNHKGMMLLDEDHTLDFLDQQILTAQNVQAHPFSTMWFGGLNHQIEHHLFPNMPRNKLKIARKIVKPFCEENSIPYYEAKAPQCYWDILKYMHRAGADVPNEKKELNLTANLLAVNALDAGETDQ